MKEKDRGKRKSQQEAGVKEAVGTVFAKTLALPKDLVLNLPLVTLMGREEINIENYKSLAEYGDGRIRVNTTVGMLCIEGSGLYIKQITDEGLTVCGRMETLKYS